MNRMFERGATLLLSTCCAVLLGSCGSGAVSAPDPSIGTPLAVSPSAVDLVAGVPTTFTITGGRGGYTAFSSNSAALPITATVNGSTFTVVANSVNADTVVDITVRDSANASASAKATVKAGTALAVSPESANLFADLPTTFTVTGGRPGYTAFSSNAAVLPVTATIAGSTFVVVPNAVTADTTVDITVRDTANTSVTAKATVKPSALLNQITFTPFGPTGTGCGANTVCSGGDAQIVVKAVQNGVILRNRQIRFTVLQGSFQLVTPGSGVLVNSLIDNTDEQGNAVARLTANVGAITQVATIETTDVTSGLARRYNFTIVQQTSGVGILSTLPSTSVTFTGPKGTTAGAEGSCLVGAMVDFYIYGGAPPYAVVSPLTGVATVAPSSVSTSGGRFTATVTGCGTVAFIVTDATGRTIETSALVSLRGATGGAATTPPVSALTKVSPSKISIGCGESGTVSLAGTGTFTTNIVTSGVNSSAFTVSSPSNTLSNILTLTRVRGTPAAPTTAPSMIVVNVVAGTTVEPIEVTTIPACP